MKTLYLLFCSFLWIISFFFTCINAKLHVTSLLELFHVPGIPFEGRLHDIRRLYSSIYTFSDFSKANADIEYHLCLFYNSTEYFDEPRMSNINYKSYLYERYHPDPFSASSFSQYHSILEQFLELGIHLVYIPIEELLIYDQKRYLSKINRYDLLNLSCGFSLGKSLLLDDDYKAFADTEKISNNWNFFEKKNFTTLQKQYSDFIIFIDSRYLITSSKVIDYITPSTLEPSAPVVSDPSNASGSSLLADFHCLSFHPSLIKNEENDNEGEGSNNSNIDDDDDYDLINHLEYYNKLYNFNLYYVRLQLIIPLMLFVHSSLLSNSQSLSTILTLGVQSLSSSPLKLIDPTTDSFYVVYAKEVYSRPLLTEKGDEDRPVNERRRTRPMSLNEEITSIAFIEIDNKNHQLYINNNSYSGGDGNGNCSIYIHIEWLYFNTLTIIQSVLQYHLHNEEKPQKWNQFTFCERICFNEKCQEKEKETKKEKGKEEFLMDSSRKDRLKNDISLANPYFVYNELLEFRQDYLYKDLHLKPKLSIIPSDSSSFDSSAAAESSYHLPRIFDCILFFNELSLLKLRLSLLSSLVTKHLILESSLTFTGKRKNLTLSENLNSFSSDSQKSMDIVILESLPFPSPITIGEIWSNEYYSRNYLLKILIEKYHIHDYDILIIADTDEIIDSDILILLSSMFLYSYLLHHHSSSTSTFPSVPSSSSFLPMKSSNIYKLTLNEYLYDFSCYLNTINGYFPSSGPTTTIVTYEKSKEIVKQFSHGKGEIQEDLSDSSFSNQCMLIRHFLQYNSMISSQYVISNYVWHLSFFHSYSRSSSSLSSVQAIKEKLESYSHQNFARRFYEKETADQNETTAATDGEVEKKEDDEKEWKMMTNHDIVPKGNISIDLIEKKLKEKKLINGKEFIKKYQRTSILSSKKKRKKKGGKSNSPEELQCNERPFDMKSFLLKKLWNEIEASK
jgi:hypothetical protein